MLRHAQQDDALAADAGSERPLPRSGDAERERSLPRGDAALRDLLAVLPSIVWTARPDGTIDFVNERLREVTGAPPAAGWYSDWDALHPDDRAAAAASWRSALASGREHRVEHRLRTASGAWRWFLTRAAPQRDAAARVVRWVGTSTDIHDQKRAQEDLRESRARLLAALEATNAGTFRFDRRSSALLTDARLARLLGEAPEASVLPVERFLPRVHPEDRPALVAALDGCARDGGEFDLTFRVIVPDGSVRWLDCRGRADDHEPGCAVMLTGACTDITERRFADSIARQKETLQTISDNIPVMVWIAQSDGRVLHVNRAFERLLGWTAESARGIDLLAALHPDLALRADLCRGPASTAPVWRDCEVRTRDDRTLRSSWTYVCLSDGSRIGIGLDLSERRRLEEQRERLLLQLRAEQQRLHERNEQLRALTLRLTSAEQQERRRIAQTLHDHFQQLLAAAKLGTEQMRRQAERLGGAAGKEPVEPLLRVVEKVRDLISETIEASRTLAVELCPPVLYDHGLVAALRWLAEHFATKHDLLTSVAADDAAEPASEEVQTFLFQAVRELLFNVVKHAGTDQADVRLTRTADDRVRVEVADHGVGCEVTDLVFHEDGPTGFGLYSLRQRAELIGGEFSFACERGLGCVAAITVPLTDAHAAHPVPPRIALTRTDEIPTQPGKVAAGGRAIRVLVADDHPILRQGLIALLEAEPDILLVAEAGHGEEAVGRALERRPDVVLMDVSMPGMDGVEATRRIVEALPDTRVIALSMHSDVETARAMIEAGAVAYVEKGGPMEELVALVRR